METILDLLVVLARWRLLLSISLSAVAAWGASVLVPGFTAPYCIGFVLLGVGFGIIWQSRAEAGVGLFAPMPPTPISKPVAFLGLMFLGSLWGGWAAWLAGGTIFGAGALIASVVVFGLWYRFILHRPVAISYLVFVTTALLSGLGSLVLLKSFQA